MNTVLDWTAIPGVTLTVDKIHLDDPHGPLTTSEILRWLLERDLVRSNGSPETFELTAREAEAAAGVRDLQAWIRS